MLTEEQLKEIRGHLNSAQNPVFFFDNDQDGLCSFLLLQKYIGRGKGFPIKTSPALTKDYFRKVEEFNSDYIFILDKPEVDREFIEEVEKKNIPIVWIDHHDVPENISESVSYYNPHLSKEKSSEPVTYICYEVTKKKEDMWIAIVGCISDNLVPYFYKQFGKDFPELIKEDAKEAFDVFYGSEIGKVARILGFGLKDSISNVINMIKFLISCRGPHDFIEENSKNKLIHRRFQEIDKKYSRILEKAKAKVSEDKLIFFKYAGDTSMSSDVANGLKYLFPDKFIVVVYTKGARANVSARGKNVKKIILDSISTLKNSTGGGHENAVGAQISREDISQFEKNVRNCVK